MQHVLLAGLPIGDPTAKTVDFGLTGEPRAVAPLRVAGPQELDLDLVVADGDGVELRLTYGPGYRVYYLQDGDLLILLLIGGDKSSQQNDIEKAQELAYEWRADRQRKEEPDEHH